jgi:hypothetical protein
VCEEIGPQLPGWSCTLMPRIDTHHAGSRVGDAERSNRSHHIFSGILGKGRKEMKMSRCWC